MKVRTTDDQREKVRDALLQPNAAWNEVIWTYLVADLIARQGGERKHLSHLFGADVSPSEPWFEAKPMPPREREGNTRVDLAAGSIRQRGDTASGIEFAPDQPSSWVGFVEAKILSDCSVDVTYDHTRNQIARVIENLLCFQFDGSYPQHLHFTLLTPRYFQEPRHRRTRLYGYKFAEYSQDPKAIIDDLGLCGLDPRINHASWVYPALAERVARLQLHWACYEDIFACEPDLADIDIVKCVKDRALPAAVRARLENSLSDVPW